MEGDSLKGALFNRMRRLSSGRHVKPKRAFSPEQFSSTPTVQKKNVKSSSAIASYDSMKRSSLLNQLSAATGSDFILPSDFFLEEANNAEEASFLESLEEPEPSTSAKSDLDDSSLLGDYDDFIDRAALANVLSYEKHFFKKKNERKKPFFEIKSRIPSNTIKYSDYVSGEKSFFISSIPEAAPSMQSDQKRTSIGEQSDDQNGPAEQPRGLDVGYATDKSEPPIASDYNMSAGLHNTNPLQDSQANDDAVSRTSDNVVDDTNTAPKDVSISQSVPSSENKEERHLDTANYLEEPEEMEYELAPSSPEEMEKESSMEYEILPNESPGHSPRSEVRTELPSKAQSSPKVNIVQQDTSKSMKREPREDEDDIKILYAKVPPSTSTDSPANSGPLRKEATDNISTGVHNLRQLRKPSIKLLQSNNLLLAEGKKNSSMKHPVDQKRSNRTPSRRNSATVTTNSNTASVGATATATITALEPVVLPSCTKTPATATAIPIIVSSTNGLRSARSSRHAINYASLANGTMAIGKFSHVISSNDKSEEKNIIQTNKSKSIHSPKVSQKNRRKSIGDDNASLHSRHSNEASCKLTCDKSTNITEEQTKESSPMPKPSNEKESQPRLSGQPPSLQLFKQRVSFNSVSTDEESTSMTNMTETNEMASTNNNEVLVIKVTPSKQSSNSSDLPPSLTDQFPQLCIKIEDSENFENKILNEMRKKDTHTPLKSIRPLKSGQKEHVVESPLINRPQRNRSTRLSDDFVYPEILNNRKGGHFRIDSLQTKTDDTTDEPSDSSNIPSNGGGKAASDVLSSALSTPTRNKNRPQRQRGTKLSDDFYYPSVLNVRKPIVFPTEGSHDKAISEERDMEAPKQSISLSLPEPLAVDDTANSQPAVTRKRKVGRPSLAAIREAKRSKVAPSSMTAMFSRRRREEERRRQQKKLVDNKPKLKFATMRKANVIARIFSKNRPLVSNDTSEMPETVQRKAIKKRVARPLSVAVKSADVVETASPRLDRTTTYPIYGFPTLSDTSTLPTLSFHERLMLCRSLNPLSCGVINRPNTFTKDFFYREVVAINNGTDGGGKLDNDGDVDVCGNDTLPPDADAIIRSEILVSSPAEQCAADIYDVLNLRSYFLDKDDSDDSGLLESQLYARAMCEAVDVAEHLKVFLRFVFIQRLTDLSTMNTAAGPSMFYSMSMTNANRLRESLRLYNKRRLSSMVDAHCWLLKNLPIWLLAAYLNLLRFLKVAGSNLSKHVVEKCEKPELRAANTLIGQFLSVKVYDPPTNSVAKIMNGVEPLKNVCLLLVYPQVTSHESHAHVIRPYEPLFKNLLPRMVQVAEKVDFRLESQTVDSIETCARSYVQSIVKHVRDIVRRRPNDHVFLAGWGTSCLLNHKAVSMVPGVSGILDFSFPAESAIGPRGEVDDDICLTYCPVLFVVGENASDATISSLQEMRKNFLIDTGLIIVGGANRNLFVSNHRLNMERTGQRCIDRAIVDGVAEFMRVVIDDIGPATNECRELLKPIELPHIYDVDLNALKHGSLNSDKDSKRVNALDDTGVQNGDHHYTKEKPRRKYTKSSDRKPRKRKNETSVDNEDSSSNLSFLTAPPPGFCTAADSVPVLCGGTVRSGNSAQAPFTAPLTSARNSFNTSLKKAVALVGRETTDSMERTQQNGNGNLLEVSTPAYVKIPTPSMLNKQLPPPLPTLPSAINLTRPAMSSAITEKLNSATSHPSPFAETPQQQRQITIQRPRVHAINAFDGVGTASKLMSPTFGRFHTPHSSPNMPTPASSRPPVPQIQSSGSSTSFSNEVGLRDKETTITEQEILQEEQAAAAAILGQLPDF